MSSFYDSAYTFFKSDAYQICQYILAEITEQGFREGMEEMTAAEMGAFIAKTRKAQNMTQSALAQRLNVTSQAVSRWERGLGFPDIGTLLPLADALGIGIDELINGSKWRKMARLEILLCVIGICVLLRTALGDYAVWRLIRIYNEAYCSNLEAQLHVPSIPWFVPYILIGLGSLIAAITLMIFRLRSVSKMLKGIDTQKKGALL